MATHQTRLFDLTKPETFREEFDEMFNKHGVLLFVIYFSCHAIQHDSQKRIKTRNWQYEYRMSNLEANLKSTQKILSDFLSMYNSHEKSINDVEKNLKDSTEKLVNLLMASQRQSITEIQTKTDQLNKTMAALQSCLGQTESELTVVKKSFHEYVLSTQNITWSLKRVEIKFPRLNRLSLHHAKPTTYEETLSVSLPKRTRAIIISVYCNFANSKGHAYLNLKINQKGNKALVRST